MKAARRKSTATRSPSVSLPTFLDSAEQKAKHKLNGTSAAAPVHELPPATFGTPALQSLIYATSNDRYPGAPGTLLHRAKLEAARALAAKQREAQREADRREEMKRLGILGVGKKRSTTAAAAAAAAAATNGNGRFATPPANERARRSNGPSTSSAGASQPNGNGGGTSTRPGRANGTARNHNAAANAIDHDSLPVPASSSSSATSGRLQDQHTSNNATTAVNGAASPLLSASGRLRRPATGSRGASPMPLTSNGNGGMMTRTRSPVVPPLELDEDQKAPGTLTGTLGVQGATSSVMV